MELMINELIIHRSLWEKTRLDGVLEMKWNH